MIVEMNVPSPGESISEVEIASWLVADGEYVEKDQEICEIDSDKATLTLAAEESGAISFGSQGGAEIRLGDETKGTFYCSYVVYMGMLLPDGLCCLSRLSYA